MKWLVPFVICAAFLSCSTDKQTQKSKFYANVAESVITPPVGTFIIEPRGEISSGIHDDLYVRALALGDGEDIYAIVSFDLIGFDDSLVSRIRKAIFDSSGITAEQLMLSCSHAHNTPITLDAMDPYPDGLYKNVNKRDTVWENKMIAVTASTVKSAVNNMKEVYLAQGKHPVQIGYNRRLSLSHRATMSPNPHGPAMKETDVVFINDEESEMAVLYSYPAHPVSVHSTSTEFSADFPGYTARYIQSRFPGIVPIFLQGCAGNINSTLKGGYEAAELDGNKLGDAVINSSLSAKAVPPSRIVYGQHNFHLPYRELEIKTTELIAKRIEESFRTMRDSNPDFQLSTLQKDLVNWSQKLRQHAANNEKGLLSQAQAIALGKSLAIIAFPDELFVEYALYIKEHSPFEQTIVLAYTNGSSSYIPTAEALFLGGYEPGYAQVVYGQPFLTPECDRIIKEESIELLNELWENYETH